MGHLPGALGQIEPTDCYPQTILAALAGDQHLDGEGDEDRQPGDHGGDDELSRTHQQATESVIGTNLNLNAGELGAPG